MGYKVRSEHGRFRVHVKVGLISTEGSRHPVCMVFVRSHRQNRDLGSRKKIKQMKMISACGTILSRNSDRRLSINIVHGIY